ncbi:hypothetical protein AB664_06335 [Brucella anthropi]|uniref:Urease alpha-subunit N-terminal domain-containing protein n=1 Tax=Brucella anthropi TaxID=529 RepID=A0A656Z7M8_BRUAN|nr:hypothetical protein AB664_06335 [Brucella anthropi]
MPNFTVPPPAIDCAWRNTELIIEIEEDRCIYGEEVTFGGGKVIRDGMGQGQRPAAETADWSLPM